MLKEASTLNTSRVPIELCSVVVLYRLFCSAEKELPYTNPVDLELVERAADVHLAYQRKNYDEFRELFTEFIQKGRF